VYKIYERSKIQHRPEKERKKKKEAHPDTGNFNVEHGTAQNVASMVA